MGPHALSNSCEMVHESSYENREEKVVNLCGTDVVSFFEEAVCKRLFTARECLHRLRPSRGFRQEIADFLVAQTRFLHLCFAN